MRNYNTLIGRYDGADGMKTGFICASGFNLVASATRGGKRLIAVVLGAPSSPRARRQGRELLERGFNRGALAWLTPSLGTVESLQPINAAPPDLRDEMCGPHRKRPAAEEADDESTTAATAKSGLADGVRAVEPAGSSQPQGPSEPARPASAGVDRRQSMVFAGPRKPAPAPPRARSSRSRQAPARRRQGQARPRTTRQGARAKDRTGQPTAATPAAQPHARAEPRNTSRRRSSAPPRPPQTAHAVAPGDAGRRRRQPP